MGLSQIKNTYQKRLIDDSMLDIIKTLYSTNLTLEKKLMTVLNVITWPDKKLKQASEIVPVDKIDAQLQKFMDDLLDTMYSYQGIGLAAIQVGVLKRILVIDVGHSTSRYTESDSHKSNPIYMINPEIIHTSNRQSTYNEGCLSFPGQFAKVVRAEEIKIEYLDYFGKKQTLSADGLLATCIQHEIDHLNGVVFIDHISQLKRNMIAKRLEKKNRLNN